MKVRRIDTIVTGCGSCPYAHFESEVGETFCTYPEEAFPLNHIVYANVVHKDCSLPEEELSTEQEVREALGLDPNTTAGVACCADEGIKFNSFCAQMVEVSGIPSEWLDKLVLSKEEKEKLQRDEDAWINAMIEDAGADVIEVADQLDK